MEHDRIILIRNGKLITFDKDIISPYDGLCIEGNIIKELNYSNVLENKYPKAEIIDASGKIIMPGMINFRSSIYSFFMRGLPVKEKNTYRPGQLMDRLYFRYDTLIDYDMLYYCSLLTCVESIKAGTTTIFDINSSPQAAANSLDIIDGAAQKAGLRTCLAYEVSDRNGAKARDEAIAENIRFIKKCREKGSDLSSAMFGLHSSYTLTDETLYKCAGNSEAAEAGFNICAAADRRDLEDALKKYGMKVIHRLNAQGILGPKSLVCGCDHIDEQEVELLKQKSAAVVHCPTMNLKKALRSSSIGKVIKSGVPVGIGTAGIADNMFREASQACLYMKSEEKEETASLAEMEEILFRNTPAIAGRHFKKEIGRLKADAFADIIILDYYPPTPLNNSNVARHILEGLANTKVNTTVINGRVLMKNRKLLYIDERELAEKSRVAALKLWEKF